MGEDSRVANRSMVLGQVQGGTRVVPGWQGGAKCHSQYSECLCNPAASHPHATLKPGESALQACWQRVVSVLVRCTYDIPAIYLRCTYDISPLFPARTSPGILWGLPQHHGVSAGPQLCFDSNRLAAIQTELHFSTGRHLSAIGEIGAIPDWLPVRSGSRFGSG